MVYRFSRCKVFMKKLLICFFLILILLLINTSTLAYTVDFPYGYEDYPAWIYCYSGFSSWTLQWMDSNCIQYSSCGCGSLLYSATPYLSNDAYTLGNNVNEVVHVYLDPLVADVDVLGITYMLAYVEPDGSFRSIAEADIGFNTYYPIGDATAYSNLYDVPSIGLHELGHLLGLGHSSNPSASMYGSFAAGETRRTLTQDDILGLCVMY